MKIIYRNQDLELAACDVDISLENIDDLANFSPTFQRSLMDWLDTQAGSEFIYEYMVDKK